MTEKILLAVCVLWALSSVGMYVAFLWQEFVNKKDESFGPVFGPYWFMYILLSLLSPHFVFISLMDKLTDRQKGWAPHN
ncbi:hypothetical protein BM525_19060 (plasmid) [Alteromonas mediterranea]|uniref:Uncharacterized protein n=1 Tax=Alteromonas mediterranea TaxID=314275 RepID=A0AAC9NTN8_9ALTE|nr:hypothetical protein [Alteromonas mediterranea]APD91984.1 hypothetical protein BM524_18865 [Alteromonas mediterranea]APD99838.1 hypothetical protein BM525_19060 [Alteromonas mediterranea]